MARLSAALLTLLLLSLSCLPRAPSPEDELPQTEPAEPTALDASSPTLGTLVSSPPVRKEMKRAGVCARCHVISVLEWGVSAHVDRRTTCQKCHGPSEAHVANERNEVSPDRLPRGEAIAELCLDCHDEGCPETEREDACQTCHHPHALVHPDESGAEKESRLKELRALWVSFNEKMEEGEALVVDQKWKAALDAFRAAEKLLPDDESAGARIRFCERRLAPGLEGFEVIGDDFDPGTGLPRKVKVPELELTMLLVPPGEFDMGADHLEGSRPVHTARVQPLYLGEFEVTQELWQRLMGSNPSTHPESSEKPDSVAADRLPVETVSWEDCQALLEKLNERVPGGGFRLPTEAEWEYACRAGGHESAGEAALEEVSWFIENSENPSDPERDHKDIQFFSPRAVGSRKPNAWGFHDMQGNVSEWCSSSWQSYPFDPSADIDDDAKMRILRGGSFADTTDLLHPALRHPERPHRRYRYNGLRLARTVTE